MKQEEIVARLRTLHPDAVIEVAGEDCSFELTVVDEAFNGQGILQRQKPILALFKEDIQSGALHALSVKAKTPQEQAEQASQGGLVQISL
jgi:acid stress-induced BolA-like protein IbaG/YrbA